MFGPAGLSTRPLGPPCPSPPSYNSLKRPCLKQIVTKFVTVDYVHEGYVRSKFGKKNPFTGGLLGK